jgi:hypothetical protein
MLDFLEDCSRLTLTLAVTLPNPLTLTLTVIFCFRLRYQAVSLDQAVSLIPELRWLESCSMTLNKREYACTRFLCIFSTSSTHAGTVIGERSDVYLLVN